MDAKTSKMLALAGAGVLAYYFFVHKKKEETISEFSNIGGKRRMKRLKKAQFKMDVYCMRHPNARVCQDGGGIMGGSSTGSGAMAPDGFSNISGAQRKWCRDNWQDLPGSGGQSERACRKRLREVS